MYSNITNGVVAFLFYINIISYDGNHMRFSKLSYDIIYNHTKS